MKITGVLIFIVGLVLAGCGTKENNEKKLTFDRSITNLYSEPQTFVISSLRDTTIIGAAGTKIHIKANSFEIEQGKSSVLIKLLETYSISEMLLNGLSTTSRADLLESDGMIYLKCEVDGKEAKLKPGFHLIIHMPTKRLDSAMKLFYGVQKENIIEWDLAKIDFQGRDSLAGIQDTIPFYEKNELFNLFKIETFGWINCDKFINVSERTNLIVEQPENQKGVVYSLVFKSLNSIVPCIPNEGKLSFMGVPKNEKVVLVGIGMTNEKELFYEMLDLNTSDNGKKFPDLKPTTKEELKPEFNKKFGKDIWSRPSL